MNGFYIFYIALHIPIRMLSFTTDDLYHMYFNIDFNQVNDFYIFGIIMDIIHDFDCRVGLIILIEMGNRNQQIGVDL